MGFVRKYLSADGLIQVIRHSLRQEKLEVVNGSDYSWQDCVMSGLAIFAFKCPSLLQFEQQITDEPMIRRNLRILYKVDSVPSDTCLRERLDQISPQQLHRPFKKIFAYLQRGKALEAYRYLDGHYIIYIDGTGQYSSQQISCKDCCEKKHKDGRKTYYHHMLGAALVHPDQKVVIPLAPEPIIKGDGSTKNDCERNASKRLLMNLRREHPHLKALIVEDGLASNFPHLSLLDELKMDYIIGVKPGDHAYLFDWIRTLKGQSYTQIDDQGKQHHFSWVSRLSIVETNAMQIMRAARARWRIENETFNTLKNQGYNFSHNYGHGYENLCSVMTMLMLLAFLNDQVQKLCCKAYQKARHHVGTFAGLFEFARSLLKLFVWESFQQLWIFIGDPNNRA